MKKRALKIKRTYLNDVIGRSFSITCASLLSLSAGSDALPFAAVAPDASRCVSIVSSVELVPECCPARLAESRFRELTTETALE